MGTFTGSIDPLRSLSQKENKLAAICLAPSTSVSPVLIRCASPPFQTFRIERTRPWIMGLLSMKDLFSRESWVPPCWVLKPDCQMLQTVLFKLFIKQILLWLLVDMGMDMFDGAQYYSNQILNDGWVGNILYHVSNLKLQSQPPKHIQQQQPPIIMEPQKTHYVHTPEHPHSQRTTIRSFHHYNHKPNHNHNHHCSMLAVVNHNTVQIYRNVGTSVVYETTVDFMCDIGVFEIVPAKGDNTDVFFVGDQLGRYFFWRLGVGVMAGNNIVKAPEALAPVYQKIPMQDKQPQFSGISSIFNSLDTHSTIFFTVSTKIIVLKIRLSKDKIFFVSPPREIACPYLDVVHMGIINGKEPMLGIVEQKQQKTFLRLHKLSQAFQCVQTVQKTNLTRFLSSPQGQQLITITNSQLSIYNHKTQQTFCTFQISESGHVASLDPATELYVYVGELGSQIVVFNKKCYKNYGALVLESEVCLRLGGHGKMADGGFLVSVIDQGHTVEFIALYEENWKSIRSIFSTSSIFSIEDLDRPHETLAVVRVSQNMHQVGILSKHLTTNLQKQTNLPSPIISLFSTNSGRSILVHTHDSNTVLLYSQQHQCFQSIFQFPPGVVIGVYGKYVVMETKVYEMDVGWKSAIRELWTEKGGIVAVAFDGKFLGLQCMDFSFKFYNTETKQMDRIRKNCHEEYYWTFCSKQHLLVASLDLPGQLKLIPVFKQAIQIALQSRQLICSILALQQYIVISFTDCAVEVYRNQLPVRLVLVKRIQASVEPLGLVGMDGCVLAYGSGQAYLIKLYGESEDARHVVTYKQLQFDSSKQNSSILYLQFCHKYLVAHQKTLSLYTLTPNKPQHTSSFRVLSVNIDQHPPQVTTYKNILYIVQNYEILTRNLSTAELLKKQSHGLKEICCVERLEIGLVVCGVNDMDSVELFVFGYGDLQILCAEALYKSESYGRRVPTAIRRKGANSFFLRQGTTITLYQIHPTLLTLKQHFCSKTNLAGYTLSLQPQTSMILASDPLRYLVVYDYRLDKLVSLCRYQSVNTINDACFVEKAVVVGDCGGTVAVVEFDLGGDEVARGLMTEVGAMRVGAEIINVSRGRKGVIYSTISGYVGRITGITTEQFTRLKQIQLQALSILQQNKNELRYQQWTNRNPTTDKLIDGTLIEKYINVLKVSKDKKEKVLRFWKSVIGEGEGDGKSDNFV